MTPSQLARAALRAAQRACDKLGDLLQPLQHGFQPFRFPRAPDMLRRQRGAKVVARTRSRASEIGSKGIDLRPYPTIPDFARVRACQESQGRRSCPMVTPSSRCASGSASWRPSAFWQRSRSCRRFGARLERAAAESKQSPRVFSRFSPLEACMEQTPLKNGSL